MEPAFHEPSLWMTLPFVVLLAAIALGPVLAPDWWGKYYAKAALGLAALSLGYYLLGLGALEPVLHTAREYVSFMALIGSLFVVAGGIHIMVKGEATPLANVTFLACGAVVANVLGTTGASMLMIRPWLRMNKYRVTAHHVVFFIFIVSNVGGCLTPIGDPPLFLGYLKGVPFWWVAVKCWPIWAIGVGFLLAVFFFVDRRNYLRAPAKVRAELAEPPDEWRFDGLGNLVFLAVILGAVFVTDPPFVREGLMGAAAVASYFTTNRTIHEANHFNFHPLQEVAILFIGIFGTMLPALDWLQLHAASLGKPSPGLLFWGSGVLSSVLDNAPTYLSFLKGLAGAIAPPETVGQVQQLLQDHAWDSSNVNAHARSAIEVLRQLFPAAVTAGTVAREQIEIAIVLGNAAFSRCLVAISVGSVFFGANTYIGNGPNFMVKSIAQHQRAHTPGFLGYVFRYTLPVMCPMLLLVWWLFFG